MNNINRYIQYLDSLNINFQIDYNDKTIIYCISNLTFIILKLIDSVIISDNINKFNYYLIFDSDYNELISNTNKLLKPIIRKNKLNYIVHE